MNAGPELLSEVGARHERSVFTVAYTRLFGIPREL